MKILHASRKSFSNNWVRQEEVRKKKKNRFDAVRDSIGDFACGQISKEKRKSKEERKTERKTDRQHRDISSINYPFLSLSLSRKKRFSKNFFLFLVTINSTLEHITHLHITTVKLSKEYSCFNHARKVKRKEVMIILQVTKFFFFL